MRLYLVRHGESVANEMKVYAGQTDVALTENGRRQARQIQPVLGQINFDKVYSSDLSRAAETQRLAIPGVEGERTPLLREYTVGTLEGMGFSEVRERYGTAVSRTRDYTPYGGENPEMVCDRLREFLSGLETQNWENVAAFAHNGIMIAMMEIVLGSGFDRSAVKSGNCAIHVFEYDGTKWRLLAWNYMHTV